MIQDPEDKIAREVAGLFSAVLVLAFVVLLVGLMLFVAVLSS